MTTNGQPAPKFLIDPYLEWVKTEGIPVYEDFGFDLLSLDLAPWGRMGARGAYAHSHGRGDFANMYVCEIPPGGETDPQRHLYEEVVYVLSGAGSTVVETPDGERSFEWHTGSLFALPLNARYRHFNGSGREPARFAAVTDLPLVMNVFRNEDFIWNNPAVFPERMGDPQHYQGDGTFIPMRPGRHMWETNFVPDLRTFELKTWKERGAGGSNIMFVLADGTMHAHISEMPVGTYKKGHRHGADFHVFAVTGHGYSLYWYEGETELRRFDWKHGRVFTPTEMLFHQHFNTSAEPARYLAVAFGGLRYPTLGDKRKTFMGMDVDVKAGGRQIEYADEDPRIREIYEAELRRNGVASRMKEIVPA
ncbi:MAG TPA: cupin domain-containing protein [Candidatus Limnocylindria bacterium]|nr:cupin domain-containing protein [Candidatus Limnocylindria bacterium]